jgi:hypothetical protein
MIDLKRRSFPSKARTIFFVALTGLVVLLFRVASPNQLLRKNHQPLRLYTGDEHIPTKSELAFSSYTKDDFPIYDDPERSGPPILLAGSHSDSKYEAAPGGGDPQLRVHSPHPRLFAMQHRWDEISDGIAVDAYLQYWNNSIFAAAKEFYIQPTAQYTVDGSLYGNGVLDVARQVQLKIKHWAYAYRMTKESHWRDRVWEEILVASGNSSIWFGEAGDNWNTK